MEWLQIDGFEGWYEVSSDGRVRSVQREVMSSDGRSWIQPGKPMRSVPQNSGYLTVVLCRNNKPRRFLIHRLVAAAFVPNPDCYSEVNHKNGNKHMNEASNLEWMDRQSNIHHAVAVGLIANKGELNQMAKLSPATVLRIRELHSQGFSYQHISDATGATKRNTQNIVTRTSWKHI